MYIHMYICHERNEYSRVYDLNTTNSSRTLHGNESSDILVRESELAYMRASETTMVWLRLVGSIKL